MDRTLMNQLISGALSAIVLKILIRRCRAMVNQREAGKHRFGAGFWG
jgi:hypothetical protein